MSSNISSNTEVLVSSGLNNPTGLVFHNNYFYIANRSQGQIYKYDINGKKEESFVINFDNCEFLYLNGNNMYITQFYNSGNTNNITTYHIAKYHFTSNSLDASFIQVPNNDLSRGICQINNKLYFSVFNEKKVYSCNTDGQDIIEIATISDAPGGINNICSDNNNLIYVTTQHGSKIYTINLNNNIVSSINVNNMGGSLDILIINDRKIISSYFSNSIYVLDDSNTVIGSLTKDNTSNLAMNGPCQIVLRNGTLYWVNYNNNTFVSYRGYPIPCFCRGTEILMADSSIKFVEDVKVGDLVMTQDGRNVSVI